MAEMNLIAPEKIFTYRVEVHQIENFLGGLLFLNLVDEYPGLSDWLAQTAKALTPEQRLDNQVILGPLRPAIAIPTTTAWPSFSAYHATLEAEDPAAMRERVLDDFSKAGEKEGEYLPREVALNDQEAFISFFEHRYTEHDKIDFFHRATYKAAHALLLDPERLKARVVSHLRTMWEEHFEQEWLRNLPTLKESAAAFQKLNLEKLSLNEVFRTITGRALPEQWRGYFDKMQDSPVVFSPMAHIGPYISMSKYHKNIVYILYRARRPEDEYSPTLDRSELLVRLNALADDIRLRILELVVDGSEIDVKTIMAALDLSQSAASRHLRQLSATGFLAERRQDGAKFYRLNRQRVNDTINTLTEFFE